MSNIWLTSDWHFGHNQPFIWEARGFKSIEEMNEEIIKRHNSLVKEDDIVYALGDCAMGTIDNLKYIEKLNGRLIIIRGNHDTDKRIQGYHELKNVEKVDWADVLQYGGYRFHLTHYPTLTSNLDEGKDLKQKIIGLYAHTHQKTKFYQGNPLLYNVGVDSHNCYPVSIEEVINDIKKQAEDCVKYL